MERRHHPSLAAAWALGLSVAAVCTGSPSRSPTSPDLGAPVPSSPGTPTLPAIPSLPPDPAGWIAFHSDPDTADDLYLTDGSGARPRALTDRIEAGVPPVWSPDGRWVAFDCCIPSFDEIDVVGADGSGLHVAGRGAGQVGHPAWSPDSRFLAYSSYQDGLTYRVRLNGSGRTTLIQHGTDASWSPDGKRLVYLSDRDGDLDIFTADADGSNSKALTRNDAPDFDPAWSADGGRILFVSEHDGNSEIYAMGADGSAQTNLSNSDTPDEGPRWSPDGRSVVYVSYRDGADPNTVGDGNAEVFVARADGSGTENLTTDPGWDGDPAWSPDGRRLVYTRRDLHAELWVMAADGSDKRMLPGLPAQANDCCAAWRPAVP